MMESGSPHDGEPSRKRRRQSNSSTIRIRASNTASPSSTELGHMRSDHFTGTTSFVGSGSGIYFVRTVRSALAKNLVWGSETIDDEMVPGEDDHIQPQNSPVSLWNEDEVRFSTAGQEHILPSITFEDLVRWSGPYFNIWHPPFPFLHAPSILGLLEKVSTHGILRLSSIEAIIVRSVLSISVADRRQMPKDNQSLIPSSLIFNTVDDAISCLSPTLMQTSTLPGLQAAVSIQVFLFSMLRLNTASRFGGLIVQMAFHLGLHRCPTRYKQFSPAEADIRRRLFWSIYSIDRFLSQSLGLPLALKDDDIDVCYPDNELHLENNPNNSNFERSRDPRLFLLPSFLSWHSQIKGLILELRHKSLNHRVTDPDEVAHIDAEISKWWNEAQDFVDPSYMQEDNLEPSDSTVDFLKPFHRLLLIVQKHESVILLNRPVITSGYNSSTVASAMQKCIGASKAIISKIYQYLQNNMKEEQSQDGRINSPLFWPGFTWCVWMSGLILLYAASNGCHSVQMAQREASRCVKILENLSLRGVFWPGACAAAIKELQQALSQKIGNESSRDQLGSFSTRRQGIQRHVIRPSQTREFIPCEASHDNVRSSPSTSTPQRDARLHNLRQNPRVNQTPSTMNPTPELGSASRTNRPFSLQTSPFPFQQNEAGFSDSWPDINGQFHPMDNDLSGFDDIFQLMDVPYHLNENTYEAFGPAN